MIDKNKMPLAIGIAFVAFTTQFGGGFASGAQIYQYFVNFGIWSLVMPFLAQLLLALFFWYGMRYAYRNKTYDYRSFSDSFYGKFRKVFSNLYELVYLMLICLAPAVAFATGGATLNMLTGIPYIVCTLFIGIFIFVIALFGTNLVRKAASTMSVMIIIGLIVVLVPNIIAQWGAITASIGKMAAGAVPVASKSDGSFGGALWTAIVYFLFQLASVGLMYQHVKPLTEEKQLTRSMIYMYIVNTACMMLTVLGMLTIAFNPGLAKASIPMLLMVQTGVGAKVLTPIISILIILGAVSTAVNMIAGIVTRVVDAVERRENDEKVSEKKRLPRNTVVSLAFTALSFAIAQFGLIPLISKGYSYLGYVTLVVVAVPFAVHAFCARGKEKA